MRLAALDRSTVGLLLQPLPQAESAADHKEPKRVCPQPSLFLLLQRFGLRSQSRVVGPRQYYVVQRFPASKLDLAALAQDHPARYRPPTTGNPDQGFGDERLQTLQSRFGQDSGGYCYGRGGSSNLGLIGSFWRHRMAQHFSKILYATDYPKASARALDEAIAMAKQNAAEL